MSESKDSVALLAFRNEEIDHIGPKLIVHDFCRGSYSEIVVARSIRRLDELYDTGQ